MRREHDKKLVVVLGLVLVSLMVPGVFAAEFEFHGYMRSGYGWNSEGGTMETFNAPESGNKWRLGNENDTYIETSLVKNWQQADKSFFKFETLITYTSGQKNNWDPETPVLRQCYIQGGNFEWAKGVSFWAGQRYYDRHDIHVLDYYFLDMSGYGAGVENLDLGFGKASIALIGGSTNNYYFEDVGRISKNTFDVRLFDINVGWGKLMIHAAPQWITGGTYMQDGEEREYEDSSGFIVGLIHTAGGFFGIERGYSKISLQYGTGIGADINACWVPGYYDNLEDASKLRFTISGSGDVNDKFSFQPAIVFEVSDNGNDSNSSKTLLHYGIRPIYHFNSTAALNFEIGGITVDSEQADLKGSLYKVTVAPTVRLNNSFWGRPEIRFFVTYATWSDEFEGRVGGEPYGDQTNGMSYGMQAEAWW